MYKRHFIIEYTIYTELHYSLDPFFTSGLIYVYILSGYIPRTYNLIKTVFAKLKIRMLKSNLISFYWKKLNLIRIAVKLYCIYELL